MAKKDSQTSDLFRGQVPRMPEEYYSGDKPNPHLRSFAEQHLQERPFSPDNDDYDVLAFARPLESTKASA
ncbi:MAG: hypothetical protein KJ052_18800, partial [Candidatus Hydrogenedentes bacterium]|nr:hypothetical protein [Candidatus Hydrogenedentota bacterium]